MDFWHLKYFRKETGGYTFFKKPTFDKIFPETFHHRTVWNFSPHVVEHLERQRTIALIGAVSLFFARIRTCHQTEFQEKL